MTEILNIFLSKLGMELDDDKEIQNQDDDPKEEDLVVTDSIKNQNQYNKQINDNDNNNEVEEEEEYTEEVRKTV